MDQDNVSERVRRWLEEEGYPLEFRVADALRRARMAPAQGHHVRDSDTKAAREIDVLSRKDVRHNDHTFRIYHVVECKWSASKPWVVFTSPGTMMAPSACISQTIGSVGGDAIMWLIRGDEALHQTELFQRKGRGGFSGRQAFSSARQTDQVYATLQGVVAKARLAAKMYDTSNPPAQLPHISAIALPIIVVEGLLFESFFDADRQALVVEEADCIRMHWRGSDSWNLLATIDIVTESHLEAFLDERTRSLGVLVEKCQDAIWALLEAERLRSLEPLRHAQGSTGRAGLPRLIKELTFLADQRNHDERRRLSEGDG